MNIKGLESLQYRRDSFSSMSVSDGQKEQFKMVRQDRERRRFQWDQNSGQFSFSQEEGAHLEAGVEKLKEMEGSSPGSLAILLRQYSGVECYQVPLVLTKHLQTFKEFKIHEKLTRHRESYKLN